MLHDNKTLSKINGHHQLSSEDDTDHKLGGSQRTTVAQNAKKRKREELLHSNGTAEEEKGRMPPSREIDQLNLDGGSMSEVEESKDMSQSKFKKRKLNPQNKDETNRYQIQSEAIMKNFIELSE